MTDDLQPKFPREACSLENTQKTLSEPHGPHGGQGTVHVFISFPWSVSFWPVHDTKVTPAPKDVKGSEMEGRVERGSGLTAARTPWWSRVRLGGCAHCRECKFSPWLGN